MNSQSTILIVEDEDLMRGILAGIMSDAGFRVIEASSGEQALELFAAETPALTITDIELGKMNGIELLDRIKQLDLEAMVIMITAYSSVETAIAALRKGAYDYITKPFINEDILQTVRNALRQRELFTENRYLRRELKQRYNFESIIGRSDSLMNIFKMIEKISEINSSVLIQGESGTGKELIARAIHYNSPRADGAFVAINCAALPENLLESELFGYVKGAFTGAHSNKIGLFKTADGGTLFLDEVSEMPPSLQVKLLRALQEREFIPLGSSKPITFDARIIAATNRNLEEEISANRFREDLYYRLSVFSMTLPPLRERREDIPLLVRYFIEKYARALNIPPKPVSDEAMQALISYEWRGNVRELQNAIERAVTLSDDTIELSHLPQKVLESSSTIRDLTGQTLPLEEVERRHILETLKKVSDDKTRAAELLGIDLSTLYRKLKKYG
ncbi:MAG: sigma-54-dependent Fis family transcriptional regulator [Acidobacteriota bacterium]|nr:MAG: sigma-54-dependent Fis family transcriptional regulator [Acidobacteriota bacterium]